MSVSKSYAPASFSRLREGRMQPTCQQPRPECVRERDTPLHRHPRAGGDPGASSQAALDPRLRGDDGYWAALLTYEFRGELSRIGAERSDGPNRTKAEPSDGPSQAPYLSGRAEERRARGGKEHCKMLFLQALTRCGCLSVENEVNNASSAAPPPDGRPLDRAPQVARSEAQGHGKWGRLSFAYFSLAPSVSTYLSPVL